MSPHPDLFPPPSNARSGTAASLAPVLANTKALGALPHNEEWWQSIFANCPVGVAIGDTNGRYMATNSSFQRMLGYTGEDMPADCNLFTESVTEKGAYFKNEKQHRRKDGSLIWLQIGVCRVPADQSLPQFLVALVEDITERKRAEEVSHENEIRFRAVLDNSPNLVFLKDPEGRYLYVNRGFETALGIRQDEAIGKKDEELFPLEQATAFRNNDLRVLQFAAPMEFEEVAMQQDGPHTSIVQKFPLFDSEGKIYATGSVVTDITERKRVQEALEQNEERFRMLVEDMQDYALYMVDPSGTVVTWNAGAARIKGYKAEEILGEHFSCFYEAIDIELGRPGRTLKMAATSGRFEDEGWRIRKDGSRFWANVITTAIRDNEGKLKGFSNITRDLTERKRFEQNLKHERDRLRLLLDINNRVVPNLDLRELFRAVSAGLRTVMRSDAALLWLPELEKEEIRIYAIDFPESKGFITEDLVCPMEGTFVGQAFRTALPVLFNSTSGSTHRKLQELLDKEGLKSGCALPLTSGGRVLGVLSLACLRVEAFTASEVDILIQVADQVAIAVENALRYHQITESKQRLVEERHYLEGEIRRERGFSEIVGKSPSLQRVLKQVEIVAATDSSVLILGETGTGKELIARAIHNLSPRREHTLVRADCASIPAGLLESELFGHEKGAFTGAITRTIGRFELANEGTLFLDEVGDIPLELQSKLLRVLQELELERLGSTRTIRLDFRLVAATNRDLSELVESGRFRRDLYYRLNVFPIEIPPLRDRKEDIPLLVWHFAKKYAQRLNKRIEKIGKEDMAELSQYHWPGNVRELQNLIERSVILSSSSLLHPPHELLGRTVRTTVPGARTLVEAEREHILQALRDAGWVVGGPSGASARLGVKRTTLLDKMRRHKISRPQD
jgi:formate hydrogenlyase transcriptional activator